MILKSVVLAAGLGLSLSATPVLASMMAPDAQMHFSAIASGDVAKIMSQYAPDATFQWIGGPLDGSYSGTKAIQSVWQKYTKAVGKTSDKVNDVVVGSDPKGMTVTANVVFQGKKAIPVRYTLAYRNGKIVDEIWQIAPNMKMQ